MKKEQYSFKVINFFDIQIKTSETGLFLFYLYKKDKLIAKSKYSNNSEYTFKNIPPGNYRVKVFKKINHTVATMLSKTILIRNISPTNIKYPNYILDQPNYDLSWIYWLLKDTINFTAYLSNEDNEKSFLGLPPIPSDKIEEDAKILTCDPKHRFSDKYDFVSLSHNSDNPLNEFLSRKSNVDLQKFSRNLYLKGYEKGAHYIWIYMRKNSGCSVSYKTEIGENFRLGLGGINTIIHPNAKIGNDVKIAQQVTIGFSGSSKYSGPIIGNNVYIAPGAMCLGGKIGSNVVIASNAVVLDEVPDNCVVAGVPAKVVSQDMTKYKNLIGK